MTTKYQIGEYIETEETTGKVMDIFRSVTDPSFIVYEINDGASNLYYAESELTPLT